MIGALPRLISALLAVLALLVAGCGGGGGGGSKSAPTPTSTQPAGGVSGGCHQVQQPQPRNPGKHQKPRAELDASKQWSLTFHTNCGDFTVLLNLKTAPHASASMVALAKAGYFDDTVFH